MQDPTINLTIEELRRLYRSGETSPEAVIHQIFDRIDAGDPKIWISRSSRESCLELAGKLAEQNIEDLPLYGIPFAIKDNIDLEGLRTTAACEEYGYFPSESAHVVKLLMAAGAIPVGKTNLDQFATGLVGVRSPYGFPGNSFNSDYIPGGSSSGSAVAVASGMVSFSLGTDTAGSGRVPASLNNLVGLKPSRGAFSNSGLIPACKSLDCISVFALNCGDAQTVFEVAAQFDANDPYSRKMDPPELAEPKKKVGVPRPSQLEFFGDKATAKIFDDAVNHLIAFGYEVVPIDFEPFLETARLLYEGPWLAERFIALEEVLAECPEILHPVTRSIIEKGDQYTALDFFKTHYRIQELRQKAGLIMDEMDALMSPTCPTVYTIAEVEADPVTLNSRLGYYTNFMNLMDLSGLAVPCGMRPDGLPHGVTFFAAAFHDYELLKLGEQFHAHTGLSAGAIATPVPPATVGESLPVEETVPVVVCGAHMKGLPLNHQLTDLGATFLEETATDSVYRFYALEGEPARPALVRQAEGGSTILVEVWSLPLKNLGKFLKGIGQPLGLGKVTLVGGREEVGFIGEACAVEGAQEITDLGSWRVFLEKK
ncbi:allophanate hydrolase [Puniceicoccus vermicola]|uniref:Allophanate hydrolase n=1 Tax=Puniceicoccus vermicola TaxID=388746 RepID=A0A7X1B1U8_9BACT|nr:allophanate hydrolase [Puniceicoccus vermicola]MBC2604073.1 allophanate hydrolase [Puniceicoccus vermicola]